MSDLTALWREDATEEETVEAYQAIVTAGTPGGWRGTSGAPPWL